MNMPDPSLPSLERPEQGDQVLDRVPPTEREQDPLRTEQMQEMSGIGSRPLTEEEREAAAHDRPRAERVYAPASERVPKPPVPGHRDFVEHPDQSTPERRAANHPSSDMHARVRVERPRATVLSAPRRIAWPGGVHPAWGVLLLLGLTCALLGRRWWIERNRPLNTLRRQLRKQFATVATHR
jgi:uncharacterized membrane protein